MKITEQNKDYKKIASTIKKLAETEAKAKKESVQDVEDAIFLFLDDEDLSFNDAIQTYGISAKTGREALKAAKQVKESIDFSQKVKSKAMKIINEGNSATVITKGESELETLKKELGEYGLKLSESVVRGLVYSKFRYERE